MSLERREVARFGGGRGQKCGAGGSVWRWGPVLVGEIFVAFRGCGRKTG